MKVEILKAKESIQANGAKNTNCVMSCFRNFNINKDFNK